MADVLTTCVKAASLYQVNTGLITVVLAAISVVVADAHTAVFPVMLISAANAAGRTVMVAFVLVGLLQPFAFTAST